MKKLTPPGIGALTLAAALALALPAQADFKVSQANFVLDCNTNTAVDFGDGFSGDGLVGSVTVDDDKSLEVFNFTGGTGLILVNCTVHLGNDSELNLAEGTNLLFCANGVESAGSPLPATCPGGVYTNFEVDGTGAMFEIELQVKKNSIIEAEDFKVEITGAEEAEAQLEETLCMRLHGELEISMNTGGDEGGDVQFKKFELEKAVFQPGHPAAGDPVVFSDDTLCGTSPNILVDDDVTLSVGGGDSEIQIEEFNHIKATNGFISLTGTGLGSQVQTKLEVTLEAGGMIGGPAPYTTVGILLSSLSAGGEVQAEVDNLFTTDHDITLETGTDGKLEVKIESVFTADGGDIDILPGAGTNCKIEAEISGVWSPDAGPGLVTAGCDLTF